MPRTNNIYAVPDGTEGIPDQTIESEKYNNYLADITKDLNDPRPISAGGTGANNANSALANLGGEKSGQLVNNYDTHVFYPGSFYSGIGASGAPPAPAGQVATHPFVGIVVSSDAPVDPPANKNIVIRAYDQGGTIVPGRIYVREKKVDGTHPNGLWGPWSIDGTGVAGPTPPEDPPDGLLWFDSESGHLYVWYNDGNSKQWVIASPYSDPALFLQKSGDTMTGDLIIEGDLTVQGGFTAEGSFTANVPVVLPPGPPVNGSDAANKDYVDTKVSDTGDTMTGNLTIRTANPAVVLDCTAKGQYPTLLSTVGGLARWQVLLGNGETETGGNAGTNFQINAYSDGGGYLNTPLSITRSSGVLNINYYASLHGGFISDGSATIAGTLGVGSTLNFNGDAGLQTTGGGTYFGCGMSGLAIRPGGVGVATNQFQFFGDGKIRLNGWYSYYGISEGVAGGFQCRHGVSKASSDNHFNYWWETTNGTIYAYINETQIGQLAMQSDYRMKKDVLPLSDMWDTVKTLKPVSYTVQPFTPPSQAVRSKETQQPFIAGDDRVRWGFIAHEVQETTVATASSAPKDAPDAIQDLVLAPVVAAVTKALQEAMTRIEQLEARIAVLES